MGEGTKNPVLDRRRVILDGAAEILAENGFHGARMAQIAGASGITGPALYRHFAGKDALHAAVLERGTDIIEDLIDRTADRRGPPEAVLRDTIAGLARDGVEHAPLWVILLRDARHLPDDERERHTRRWTAIVAELARRVRAVRPGLPAGEAELIARAALVFTASPSSARVRGMNDARRRRLLERMLTALTEVRYPGSDGADPDRPGPPSAPAELPHPVPRAARREAIVGAAHHLFRWRGFHEVSMEDIAFAAGVTGPTVYSYFESKADLLVVAQQRGSSGLALALERVLRTEDDPRRRHARALATYVDFALDHGDTMAVLVREACNLPDHNLPTVLRDQYDYTTELASLLRDDRPGLEEATSRAVVAGCLDVISSLAVSRRYVGWSGLRPRLLAFVDAVSSVGGP